MCGVYGIIFKKGAGRVDVASLQTACAQLAHRGPDGHAIWTNEAGTVGFAHTRLAIVDPDPRANQPMATPDGSLCVVFNGEIYNHRALRTRLEACGHQFLTDHSDTEILLHGFREWGVEGLLAELDGMFAFVLWDEVLGQAHLCRDRLGIKPLFWEEREDCLVFCSDIRPLVEGKGAPPTLNRAAMKHYLTYLVTPAPDTMFEGIKKLPAGCWAVFDRVNRLCPEVYWDMVCPSARFAAAIDFQWSFSFPGHPIRKCNVSAK
jgi:asparagine synthase (glutamine-hydrolysing)